MENRTTIIHKAFDEIDEYIKHAVTDLKLTDSETLELVTMISEHYSAIADKLTPEAPAGVKVIDAADPHAEMDACPTCGQWLKEPEE